MTSETQIPPRLSQRIPVVLVWRFVKKFEDIEVNEDKRGRGFLSWSNTCHMWGKKTFLYQGFSLFFKVRSHFSSFATVQR